jgi:hypothetical protein
LAILASTTTLPSWLAFGCRCAHEAVLFNVFRTVASSLRAAVINSNSNSNSNVNNNNNSNSNSNSNSIVNNNNNNSSNNSDSSQQLTRYLQLPTLESFCS